MPVWAGELLTVLICLGAAAVTRFLIDAFSPGVGPFVLLFPAALVATLIGGWRCGALAFFIAEFWAWYYVVPPLGLRFKGEAQPANLALIFFAGMAVVAAAQAFRARSRREVRERQSEVAERDLMLRELDHRMKNNFQTVASLLKLQLRRTADEPARDALQEALNRVLSISEAHRNLYAAGHDLAHVDMGVYLSDLCANLADALLLGEMVRLECSVEPGALDRDRAVAVGLIVNELVTNAAKHAFIEGKPGQIRVAFGRQPEGFRLTVEDNGRGLPPDYATRGHGLGRGLVEAFTRQAGGSLTVGKGPGAKFEVDLAA
jgi:two-component sensor histidine kinase